ncbi:MAG: hypothetical protein OXF27_00240 [Acidobacteria bacterium]|nr:hypothetical protein [Acidobacteriota bacterium]
MIQFEHDGAKGLPDGVTVTADRVDSNTAALEVSSTTGAGELVFGKSSKAPRSESTTVRITITDPPTAHPEKVRSVEVANTEIVLTFEDGREDDGDWLPETFSMTVGKHEDLGAENEFTDAGTKLGSATSTEDRLTATRDPYVNPFTSSKFTVTIDDDDPKPKFRFSSRNIQLAQENVQEVTVSVGVGAGGAIPVPGAADTAGTDSIGGTLKELGDIGSHDVLLTVAPEDAVGRLITIMDDMDKPIHPDTMGRYNIGLIATTAGDGIKFKIKAKAVSGFRDEQVTLMVMDGRTAERMEDEGGGIDEADPATVTVVSGAETPTVTFSKSSISIEEGGEDTVHLLADTEQGDKVNSAAVSVSGDALISLRQNGSAISGGVVSFGGSANAELTVKSLSDPDLETGEEKTATVTITDASGANIGEQRTLMVTVVGSTSVPVLPLVAQLLLALLLTVGGARLYRRRQQ